MMTLRMPSMKISPLLLATAVMVTVFFVGQSLAFASTDFDNVQRNISKNIVVVPRFVAMLGYVIAAFFAMSGLLKLKDWLEDGERNSINPVIFRFGIAALLILFPYLLTLVNSVIFGGSNGLTQNNNVEYNAPAFSVFEKATN